MLIETHEANAIPSSSLYVYLLEAKNPDQKIFVVHFRNVSFVAVPEHHLILWDSRPRVEATAGEIEASWDELRFNQDKLLKVCLPAIPSHYPGKPTRGTLGCSITHLQALQSRRNLVSEKEFLPSTNVKTLGQYDTPFWLALNSAKTLLQSVRVTEDSTFTDPMAGEGSFLEAALHLWLLAFISRLSLGRTNSVELSQKLAAALRTHKRRNLYGIEVDVCRIRALNSNFSEILKQHFLSSYDVAINSNFFSPEIGTKRIDYESTIFLGNPGWDVIEAVNSVRSRAGTKVTQTLSVEETLLQQRELIVRSFNSTFNSTLSARDCRNIYSLTLAQCLVLSKFKAPVCLILPKGVLGDQGTAELRRVIRLNGPSVLVDEIKNKACGARIFPAVDARVQFCTLGVVPSPRKSNSISVRSHDIHYNPDRPYVSLPWKWTTAHLGAHEQWIALRDNTEKTLLKKMVRFPKLESHSTLRFYAGSPKKDGQRSIEGKDFEQFRLRTRHSTDSTADCVFIRKILSNGSRKLIAATALTSMKISDSVICIEASSDLNEPYYLSGVLNSLVGEYRLRLFQSNINLNLWKLKEFHIPEYDKTDPLHREIASLAKRLERRPSVPFLAKLESLVRSLFSITASEAEAIRARITSVDEAVA